MAPRYTRQKSGLYRTAIQIGYSDDGKPIKKYFSAGTIKELEQKIFEAKSNLANGLVISDYSTFGEYADKWLNIFKANRSYQTKVMYKHALKCSSSLNDIPIKKVNRLMIQQIINDNAVHPRTCEQIRLTLKQIFDSAREDGLLVKNPAKDVELPRHLPLEKRALTEEEKQKLRSAVLLPKERLLLVLLYGTGCRPAEAYALTKSDFDFKKGTVNIDKSVQFDYNNPVSVSLPKTNASVRSVIVSEPIMRTIKHLLDKIPFDNVLGGKTGQIQTRARYNGMFNRILRKSGLTGSGITMYTLRHNFCTECWYNGLSLKECQRQMGHSNFKMVLEVYSHLDEQKENTRQKMASMVM